MAYSAHEHEADRAAPNRFAVAGGQPGSRGKAQASGCLEANHRNFQAATPGPGGGPIGGRVASEGEQAEIAACSSFSTRIIMALINRKRPGHEQVHAYARFQNCIEALTKLTILPFDESAARLFENLKRQRLRCGTMDLKIAAICLVHDGLLLTRNLSDFAKIPGLRVENWLD